MSFEDLYANRAEYMEVAELLATMIPRCNNTAGSINHFVDTISQLKRMARNNDIIINLIKMIAMNRLNETMLTEMGEIVTFNDLITEIALYMARHNL